MVFVVAASGLPLPAATPVRPPDRLLLIEAQWGGQGGVQVLDLGQGELDQLLAGIAAPFWASARMTVSQARASIDKVVWAYQPRQVRTW
jgi:hypothetical protein